MQRKLDLTLRGVEQHRQERTRRLCNWIRFESVPERRILAVMIHHAPFFSPRAVAGSFGRVAVTALDSLLRSSPSATL
jgi:hypothetical protein